jgi:hypothetical protein
MFLIIGVYAADNPIITGIKKDSTGVAFSDNGFGGQKVNVNDANNKIEYMDSHGTKYTLSELPKGSTIELDSKGNLIRADFISSKSVDVILGGNIKTNVPANSRLTGVDGKNFEIALPTGTGSVTEPVSLYPSENTGNTLVNYNAKSKSSYKFSDFNLQEGTISHNGKSYLVKGGNTAILNQVSFFTRLKEGDMPIYFDEKKVPQNLKSGYSLIDFKKGSLTNFGTDGKTEVINFKAGNTIAPVNDNNNFGFAAGANGKAGVQNNKGKIYSYVQGKYVWYNGQLYLYYQGKGLVGFFNRLFGTYSVTPVYLSTYTADGNVLMKDSHGNPLGLYINQGQNGWPQISTGPMATPENPNPAPTGEMPNWQHNPDPGNSPVAPPITPDSTPADNSPTDIQKKQEFIRDLSKAQPTMIAKIATGTVFRGGENLNELFKTRYPELYNKHFTPGSTTTLGDALAEFKALLVSESAKYGSDPATVAATFKKNQPDLYNKYGGLLGFY